MNDREVPLTLEEAAPIAGVSARTLAHHAAKGTLKAMKLGKTWLVYRVDLDAYINDPELHRPGLAKGQKVRRSSSTDEK